MSAHVNTFAIWLLLTSACAPKFQSPPPTAPHAVVDFQAIYHVKSAARLTQTVSVDGKALDVHSPNRVSNVVTEKGIRVNPTYTRWRVLSQLTHAEITRERGPAQVRDSAACQNGLPTCQEVRTEEREQWASEHVIDARCGADLNYSFQQGHSYLVQFDFHGDERCSLKVVER